MAPRHWRQTGAKRFASIALSGLVALIFVGTSVACAIVAATESPATAAYLAFFAPLGCLTTRTFARMWRVGLTIGPDGVVVTGPLRTTRVPLADADAFEATNRGGNQPTIVLHRYGGQRRVWVWSLNRDGFIWSESRLVDELEPLADELNRALAAARV